MVSFAVARLMMARFILIGRGAAGWQHFTIGADLGFRPGFRWGGDEFLVTLPGNEETATRRAEQLMKGATLTNSVKSWWNGTMPRSKA